MRFKWLLGTAVLGVLSLSTVSMADYRGRHGDRHEDRRPGSGWRDRYRQGHHRVDYQVFARHRHHCGEWRLQGTFDTRWEADRAARHLEYRGYHTRVEATRGC